MPNILMEDDSDDNNNFSTVQMNPSHKEGKINRKLNGQDSWKQTLKY